MTRAQRLNRPLFLLAVALLGLVLLAELGVAVVSPFLGESTGAVGWGIPALALLDAQLVFTALLMGAPLVFPESVTGRIQGISTFVAAIILVIACVTTGLAAFGLLTLLIGLLLAPPIGPGIYAAMGYASFPTGTAATTLSLIMLTKLVSCGVLVMAHPRFLENKGLVLMIGTSLLGTIVVSFLHGFPPGFVVSVADLIATIVVVILAVIWAIFALVLGGISVIKAVT
ncbi:hypothetical protein DES49_1861 [Halospina denitrificans]|uniref:Uncharacterized protein n=1 Tax=Halospina denitrificans TaxID=332522 RepID=A0A4R7JXG2_9GAMM|nr:hypothetical protein [Halospina denitrificans]TDT41759.1 hypothetical protein DES49_1861 [Halospina denitrificans]